MGIISQRTCFNAPPTLAYASKDTTKGQGRLAAQDMPQRRQEIDELVDLARVMAYVSILKPALFTHDQELTATVETLTERLFPPSFDWRRIGRTFRKIAENTLVRGIRNQSRGTSSPSITDQCVIEYAEHCRVPIWVPQRFEHHCAALMGRVHHARTWVDLDAMSEECSAPTRFKGCIRKFRLIQGLIDLGLPSLSGVNSHNAAELEKHALKFDLSFHECRITPRLKNCYET